jgi:uncharacterized protein (DUF1697 family)
MTVYIAFLRAVNVGGTGKLAMSALKAICEDAGFAQVRTFIASGNVVFESRKSEKQVKAALEASLEAYGGKSFDVLIRTAAEIAAVLARMPFQNAAPARFVAIFLDGPPPSDTLQRVTGRVNEEIRLGQREIYVHFPNGQGKSKLKIPAASSGTARNMNTVAKLAAMAAEG